MFVYIKDNKIVASSEEKLLGLKGFEEFEVEKGSYVLEKGKPKLAPKAKKSFRVGSVTEITEEQKEEIKIYKKTNKLESKSEQLKKEIEIIEIEKDSKEKTDKLKELNNKLSEIESKKKDLSTSK